MRGHQHLAWIIPLAFTLGMGLVAGTKVMADELYYPVKLGTSLETSVASQQIALSEIRADVKYLIQLHVKGN